MEEFLQALADAGVKPAFDSPEEYRAWCSEFRTDSEEGLRQLGYYRKQSLYADVKELGIHQE